MAVNRIWLVLLGTQLSQVDSVNRTAPRHGTIRFHPRQSNSTQVVLQQPSLIHVVNRTRTRHKVFKPEKKPHNSQNVVDTIGQVTALFSNTFYNIFNFQEKRPLPKPTLEVSNSDTDYETAYQDYISSVIGSDLESAVNGDGKEEYYYQDDYIDYEFDSISQIEDTTHGTPKVTADSSESRTVSSKSGKQLQLLVLPAPLVLFSIALTLFGLLQILFAKHKNSQSGNMSCLPDDGDDECVYVIAETNTNKSVESGLIDEEPLSM